MTNTTSTQRSDMVEDEIADLQSLLINVQDLVTPIDLANKESAKIPSLGTMQLNSVFGTDATAVGPSQAELIITGDQEKWYNNLYDIRQEVQDINGNYPRLMARNSAIQLKAAVDKNILDYYCWGAGVCSGSTTTFNPGSQAAGAQQTSIARSHWLNALSAIRSIPGVNVNRLLFILDPWAAAGVKNLTTLTAPIGVQPATQIGIARIGQLEGVDCVESNGLPGSAGNQKTHAIASFPAGAANSSYTTASLGANHGLLAGMSVFVSMSVGGYVSGTSSGLAAPVAGSGVGSVPITSVTATTVVLPITSSLGAAASTGTVFDNFAVNLLIDRDQVFFGPQLMFASKFVDMQSKMAKSFQLGCLFGRQARNGYIMRILSPYQSI
jgi:hypothetical protein